jgi:hypothetical protein
LNQESVKKNEKTKEQKRDRIVREWIEMKQLKAESVIKQRQRALEGTNIIGSTPKM